MESMLLDVAGHRRSPATMPGYHRGRTPRNKGEQYPADPPTVEEIVAVMRTIGDRLDSHRLRALIVLLWRAGLRISEALALQASDLDRGRGAVLDRRGKGGKRREVGMDRWAWEQLHPWLEIRRQLPFSAVLCVIHGSTAGRRWEASAARKQLHHAASAAGVRRRFAPHQLRHAYAVEMAHEGVPLVVIQRQLGHANRGITSVYLQGIDSSEIISTVHGRPSPSISATAGLEMRRYIKCESGRLGHADRPGGIRVAGEEQGGLSLGCVGPASAALRVRGMRNSCRCGLGCLRSVRTDGGSWWRMGTA
jgi:hypothetical protein